MSRAPINVRVRLVPLRAEREDAAARAVETLLRLGREEPAKAAEPEKAQASP